MKIMRSICARACYGWTVLNDSVRAVLMSASQPEHSVSALLHRRQCNPWPGRRRRRRILL